MDKIYIHVRRERKNCMYGNGINSHDFEGESVEFEEYFTFCCRFLGIQTLKKLSSSRFKAIRLQALMDFPFRPFRAHPDFQIFLCLFPFLCFFLTHFLRCLHILCIKEANREEKKAHTRRRKCERKIIFCWIIFKDKSEIFSRSSS